MAFEQKPGTGSIFKNDRKTESKHPDYQGVYRNDQGQDYRVALWVKDGKKGKFFSMAMTETKTQPEGVSEHSTNSDLPF